jgi:hypothetical protein
MKRKRKKFTEFNDFIAWFKNDYKLGLGNG